MQHDRAPLFVLLADGALRNGYTVKIANKTSAPATFELRLRGWARGAVLAEDQSKPAPLLTLPVPADRSARSACW